MDLQELLKLFHLLIWISENAHCFKLLRHCGQREGRGGEAVATPFLWVEVLNLDLEIGVLIKLRPTWAVMGLNVSDLSLLPQGPCLDSAQREAQELPCSLLELGSCKSIGKGREAGRKPGTARPGVSPGLPPHAGCREPHLGHGLPGALLPGSGARFSPCFGHGAVRKR